MNAFKVIDSQFLNKRFCFFFLVKLPPEVLITLLIKMADAEARLSSGCSERIELAALIAAFQVARDQVKVDGSS